MVLPLDNWVVRDGLADQFGPRDAILGGGVTKSIAALLMIWWVLTVFPVGEIRRHVRRNCTHPAPVLCVTRYRPAFFIGTRRARMSYAHLKVLTRMKLEITRPLLKMAGLTPLLCCLVVAQQNTTS